MSSGPSTLARVPSSSTESQKSSNPSNHSTSEMSCLKGDFETAKPPQHRRAGSTSFFTFPNSITSTLDSRSQLVSRILLRRPISLYLTGPLARWVRVSTTIIPERDLHILRRLHTPSQPLTICDSESRCRRWCRVSQRQEWSRCTRFEFNYVFSLLYEFRAPSHSNSV